MPIRKNKKRIDPRYFLNETTNRDEIEEGFTGGSWSGGDRSDADSTARAMGREDPPGPTSAKVQFSKYQELADILTGPPYNVDPRKVQEDVNACGEEGMRGEKFAFQKCMLMKNTNYRYAMMDVGLVPQQKGR